MRCPVHGGMLSAGIGEQGGGLGDAGGEGVGHFVVAGSQHDRVGEREDRPERGVHHFLVGFGNDTIRLRAKCTRHRCQLDPWKFLRIAAFRPA